MFAMDQMNAEFLNSTMHFYQLHHVNLNDPYLVMNNQLLEEGHSDYLTMLSPPNFEHLSSPHLCRKSSYIFSPCLAQDPVFSFDVDSNEAQEQQKGRSCDRCCIRGESRSASELPYKPRLW